MGGSSPSALELSVLGLLDRQGPLSTYAVRKVFERSPSSHWSGSAGAVYPAMRRLEAGGLVGATRITSDRRGTIKYELTASGRKALRDWLRSAIAEEEASYAFDPVRLRVLFMECLPIRDQRALVRRAITRLEQLLETEHAFGAEVVARGVRGAVRANRGARLVLEARIRWLKEIATELSQTSQAPPP